MPFSFWPSRAVLPSPPWQLEFDLSCAEKTFTASLAARFVLDLQAWRTALTTSAGTLKFPPLKAITLQRKEMSWRTRDNILESHGGVDPWVAVSDGKGSREAMAIVPAFTALLFTNKVVHLDLPSHHGTSIFSINRSSWTHRTNLQTMINSRRNTQLILTPISYVVIGRLKCITKYESDLKVSLIIIYEYQLLPC